MNTTLITELEKLNEAYPFRVFELETLDGRRIRVTQRFRKLWTREEKQDGDIRIEGGMVAFLRYSELKDVIYFVPVWKRPFDWLYYHPEWLAVVMAATVFGMIIGISLETCTMNAIREKAPAEQRK
jgi:hypothetical protein